MRNNQTLRPKLGPKLVLTCHTRAAQPAQRLCVTADSNPEFAAAPRNYAHFLLSFVYPLFNLSSLLRSGRPVDVWVSHGNNYNLLFFRHHLAELLNATQCNSTRIARHWPMTALDTVSSSCDEVVSVRIPVLSMETGLRFYDHIAPVSDNLLSRLGIAVSSVPMRLPHHRCGAVQAVAEAADADRHPIEAAARILVVLRGNGTLNGARKVAGLEKACESTFVHRARARYAVAVECIDFGSTATMHAQARAVSNNVIGVIGVHGAAMANGLFSRPGSVFVEIHPVADARLALRRMHLRMARALRGVDSCLVWLGSRGRIYKPQHEIRYVRRSNRTGQVIKGSYQAPMRINDNVLEGMVASIANGRSCMAATSVTSPVPAAWQVAEGAADTGRLNWCANTF